MYRNKLSPLHLDGPKDVIVDLWIGSSEVMGIKAFTAELISPLAANATTPLTVSRIWDRWISPSRRYTGDVNPDSFDWDLTPLASGSVANTTTFAYGQGLYYQEETPVKATSMNLDATPYHHAVLLGVTTSSTNDNVTTIPTKLVHWSPLVTGAGTLTDGSTDFGALQHYIVNYLTPAIKNLQAAGHRVFIGGLYVSISGDALSIYSFAEADSWGVHFGMIRREIEATLGFIGIPTVVVGVARVDSSPTTGADMQDVVRDRQQEYVEDNRATTLYFDTTKYPTDDKVHFDAQSTLDIGREVTAFRYSQRDLGLALITKAL